ncbi:MAG: hypothetical protein MZV70_33370 [Desulfobacterales bacterium]|nr:hypothetical protein [Desulfobacterales bacterium]
MSNYHVGVHDRFQPFPDLFKGLNPVMDEEYLTVPLKLALNRSSYDGGLPGDDPRSEWDTCPWAGW